MLGLLDLQLSDLPNPVLLVCGRTDVAFGVVAMPTVILRRAERRAAGPKRLGGVAGVRYENLMDIVGKVLVETIAEAGYRVDIVDDGRYVVTAVAHRGGERFIVRGADPYAAVVELARQVGIELEDG